MTTTWYRQPKVRRKLIYTGGVLGVLLLIVTFAPTYIAHYFIADILQGYGIEHEGIKTVKVNLWKRELWLGPVRFHAGKYDPGQLGKIGLKIRVIPAFNKHALVERIIIRDIDITVMREQDNTFTINGVSLSQFMSPTSDVKQTEQTSKEKTPWGFGLVDFEMQSCHFLFTNKHHGKLVLDIDNLQLSNFQTWRPDNPGMINLQAKVNDIVLNVTGQARPFAQHITINLDSELREIEFAKILRLTGASDLDAIAGIYDSTIHHEVTYFDTGRIEGISAGKIDIKDIHYARTGEFSVATDDAKISLDARYDLSEQSELNLNGQVNIELNNADIKLAGENEYQAKRANLQLVDLSSKFGSDSSLKILAKPEIELEQGKYSGRMELSMDVLLHALSFLQSISKPQQVSAPATTGLEKWSGGEVILPKSEVTVSSLRSQFSKFELDTAAGKVLLDMSTETNASKIQIESTERKANIDSVSGKLKAFKLSSGQEEMNLQVDGETSVSVYAMRGPIGKGTLAQVNLAQDIALDIKKGNIGIAGDARAQINGVDIVLHKTEELPQADFKVASLITELNNTSISITDKDLAWRIEAGTVIDKASIEYTGVKKASASFERMELQGAKLDQDLNVTTRMLQIKKLESTVTRQYLDGLLAATPQKTTDEKKSDVASKKTDSAATEMPHVKLGKIGLINGAKIRFLDEQVQPPVIVNLDIEQAELTNVDTRDQNLQSRADVRAKLNEFTHFELQGQAVLPGPKMDLTLTSKLENFELPAYTSYAAEFGGVNFEQGQLNTDINLNANKGALNGEIKVNVQHLDFTPLSAADAERLSAKAGIPIEMVAGLLQDPNGNIVLTFPISGSVNEPDVDISQAVNKALGSTLKTIFPPTLVMSILSSAGSKSGMTFEAIKFKSGSAELDAAARKYMNELEALLKERPKLALNVCGHTTPEDFEAVTGISIKLKENAKPAVVEQRLRLIETHSKSLLDLAKERTQTVRRYLINEKGLSPRQVGECRPVFDPDDYEPPRVIVKI